MIVEESEAELRRMHACMQSGIDVCFTLVFGRSLLGRKTSTLPGKEATSYDALSMTISGVFC